MPAYANTQARFEVLWGKTIGKESAATAWRALDAGYGEPHRAYHNWSHIGAMLSGLDEAAAAAEFDGVDSDAVELAIFFHDVIYDPRAKDSEEKSAELFRDLCAERSVNQASIQRVAQMILATTTHAANTDPAMRLLLDLDLRVLGGAPQQYREYAEAVRAEYRFVPEEAWRNGRAAVLRRFLERNQIFQTAYFSRLHEAGARKNIATELQALAET